MEMLQQKIRDEMKAAMVAKDQVRLDVLRGILSGFTNELVAKKRKPSEELNDDEVLEVIASEVKKRKESIESFKAGGREEMAQSEKEELNILMVYMPEQMSEEQIREEARKAIAETGAKDIKEMGKVLGVLMPKVKGKADGTLVSRIVKEELQK